MQSYLNIIDISNGRQVRVAELGYYAECPSFCEDGISFYRDNYEYFLSLNTGSIKKVTAAIECSSQNLLNSTIHLELLSELNGGIAYTALVHEVLDESGKTVERRILHRFMGNKNSIGKLPVSDDGSKVVFISYSM